MTEQGTLAAAMLREIAAVSEPGPGVTRLPFTEEHRRAGALIAEWMKAAGLETRWDDAGTLIGRREGTDPSAGTFLLGSHQDSVRQGGAFDGIMGIVLSILAMDTMRTTPLPFAVEVLAFADEEGVRFPTALLGPRALAGTLPDGVLEMTDRNGTSVRAALAGFGCNPEGLSALVRERKSVRGYLETHIEQGPVLEAEGLPLGIVTAIAGIERHSMTIAGRAGHAGTIPMALRHDALCVAAATVGAVERICSENTAVLGTVGMLEISPNVVNAIPGDVRMTVELRSADDAARAQVRKRVAQAAETAAEQRGCRLQMQWTYEQPATACDIAMQDRLAQAMSEAGLKPRRLMSGATHDASAMADLAPIAMLFLRCAGGISHNPAEHAGAKDMGAAIDVIRRFLLAEAGLAAASAARCPPAQA